MGVAVAKGGTGGAHKGKGALRHVMLLQYMSSINSFQGKWPQHVLTRGCPGGPYWCGGGLLGGVVVGNWWWQIQVVLHGGGQQ